MTSDPEIMEVSYNSRLVDMFKKLIISGWSFRQVTEEEAKKIEEETKKEQQASSAEVKPDSTTTTDAEKKEETPSETKKVNRIIMLMSSVDKID